MLEAKVRVVNGANEYANLVYGQIRALLVLGEKIRKSDGGLTAAFLKRLPEFPNTNTCSVVFQSSITSVLCWTVRVAEFEDHRGIWHEVTLRFGTTRNGVLAMLYDVMKPLRHDYTVEGVQQAQKEYNEAQQRLTAAKIALHPFADFSS